MIGVEDTRNLIQDDRITLQATQLVLSTNANITTHSSNDSPQAFAENTSTGFRPPENNSPVAAETGLSVTTETGSQNENQDYSLGLQPFTWKRVRDLILVVFSSALYCGGVGLAKQVPYISTPQMCSAQCIVGVGALSLWATHQNAEVFVSREKVVCLVMVAVSGASGLFLTVFCAQHMHLGDAVLLLYTAPLFSGLFAKLLFREKCGVVNFTSAFACILGIVFTLQPPLIFSNLAHKSDELTLRNCALGLLGAVALGVCYILVRIQGFRVPLPTTLLWINLLLLVASLVVQLISSQPYSNPQCGIDRLYMLLSGLLILLSLAIFFFALARDVTTPAVLMRNCDVIFGYALQWVWFEEEVDVLNVIGLLMICGGVSAVFIHKLLKNVKINLSWRSKRYKKLVEDVSTVTNSKEITWHRNSV